MSRVGVAVELWSETARPLLRTAADFARSLGTEWAAIAVLDRAHSPSRLDEQRRKIFEDNVGLVHRLGGTPFISEGDEIARTLLETARLARVDLLILGKPRQRGILARAFGDHISTSVLRRAAGLLLMFAAYPDV